MLFSKEFLSGFEGDTIEEHIIDHRRWSVVRERVFRHEGKFYCTVYSVGATEYQDMHPYEYDDDMIECEEVELVPRLMMVWVPKEEAANEG